MKCLVLLKNVGAPLDNLLSVFTEILQDPASVAKLQIKQLLLALDIVMADIDQFREQTTLLKVCLARLESFLEQPNVSLKLRVECLWRYFNITEILDCRSAAFVERLSK